MPKLLLLTDSMVHNESEIESRHGRLLRVYLPEVESTNTFATQLIRSESENFELSFNYESQNPQYRFTLQESGILSRFNLWARIAVNWRMAFENLI